MFNNKPLNEVTFEDLFDLDGQNVCINIRTQDGERTIWNDGWLDINDTDELLVYFPSGDTVYLKRDEVISVALPDIICNLFIRVLPCNIDPLYRVEINTPKQSKPIRESHDSVSQAVKIINEYGVETAIKLGYTLEDFKYLLSEIN